MVDGMILMVFSVNVCVSPPLIYFTASALVEGLEPVLILYLTVYW